MTERQWWYPRGSLASGPWETVVDGRIDGWEHTGVMVGSVGAGDRLEVAQAGTEKLVIPLAGSFTVRAVGPDGAQATYELAGRSSVFDGPTDVLYLSCDTTAQLSGGGRVAVATAPTTVRRPDAYLPAGDVPIELRGAGASSRQVHNFGRKEVLDAAKFIVVEVITPADNWSSYPPHKHDRAIPGVESQLEEIYYFESAPAAGSPEGVDPDAAFGLFSTYGSEEGEIRIDAQAHTGDVALVPYGYHGPAVAAPGYDLYYLNVMAGPDPDRSWLITDDPHHAWVRASWEHQDLDPRLPFGGPAS